MAKFLNPEHLIFNPEPQTLNFRNPQLCFLHGETISRKANALDPNFLTIYFQIRTPNVKP
jgi:hypothetical protein